MNLDLFLELKEVVLNDFDVFVFVFHVQQLLWELNLNKAKSLEFEGCINWGRKKKGGGEVRFKTNKGGPLVLSNGNPPPFFFSKF